MVELAALARWLSLSLYCIQLERVLSTDTWPPSLRVGAQVLALTTPPLKRPYSAPTFESSTVTSHSRLVSMAKPWLADGGVVALLVLATLTVGLLVGPISLLSDMPSIWYRLS